MKNPAIFWLIAIIAYSATFSFLVPLHAEELRYIEGAKHFNGNILSDSGLFYADLNTIGEKIGYENAIKIFSFILLSAFLYLAYEVLPDKSALILLMLFPSFPALIFTQIKNLLVFAFFIAIYSKVKHNSIKGFGLLISALFATFYGIMAVIFLPFYLFFKDKMFEQSNRSINLVLLGLFVILNIGYWGSLGFHQFQTGVHEESGLVDTVITLALICAWDWSLVGTVSLVFAIILFALGQPYWAYRPLEVMAISAVVLNGTIILKTLRELIPAWLMNMVWKKSEAKQTRSAN